MSANTVSIGSPPLVIITGDAAVCSFAALAESATKGVVGIAPAFALWGDKPDDCL